MGAPSHPWCDSQLGRRCTRTRHQQAPQDKPRLHTLSMYYCCSRAIRHPIVDSNRWWLMVSCRSLPGLGLRSRCGMGLCCPRTHRNEWLEQREEAWKKLPCSYKYPSSDEHPGPPLNQNTTGSLPGFPYSLPRQSASSSFDGNERGEPR